MKTRISAFAALLAFTPAAFCQANSPDQSLPRTGTKPITPTVSANYGKLPLSFEANQGQADPRAKFLSHGNGYSLLLTDTAAVLELSKPDPASQGPSTPKIAGMSPVALARARRPVAMKTDVVRMELSGARHHSPVVGDDPLPGKSNYFVGNDSAKWHTNIPTYAKVKYNGVYPGVDLVYYGNQQQLEYDFVVAPGATARLVKLHFSGATQLQLSSDGDLAVIAKNGKIAFHKPVIYQEKDGQRQPVEGNFTLLAKNTVGFEIGDYDHRRELIIDPVLAYSTYLTTGTANALAVGMAIDSAGDVFIAGPGIGSPATNGSYRNGSGGGLISVIKVNPAGTGLVYSAIFGGTTVTENYQVDAVSAIAVDSAGNAYVTGQAGTTDYPVTSGAYQTVNHRDHDRLADWKPHDRSLLSGKHNLCRQQRFRR